MIAIVFIFRLFLIASLAVSLLSGGFATPAFSATVSARKCCKSETRATCCGMACCQTPAPQNERPPLSNEASSGGRELAGFDLGLPAGRPVGTTPHLLRLRAAANVNVPVSGAPSLVALLILLRV